MPNRPMTSRLSRALAVFLAALSLLSLFAVACSSESSPVSVSYVRQAATTCTSWADCEDAEFCTRAKSNQPSHTCEHQKRGGCCPADTDCDDGVSCTKDTCNTTAFE